MSFFSRWLIQVLSPSPSEARYVPGTYDEIEKSLPPIGVPTETNPLDDKIKELEEKVKALEDKKNKEKIAVHSVSVLVPGDESGPFSFEYYFAKNLIVTEEHAVFFRALVHNKRVTGKKPQDNVPELSDYPPMLENENVIDYMERVENLPYMEWNDLYFDETMTIRYRGRTVYTYDEAKFEYTYLRGDRLSTKDSDAETEKSTVLPFKPNKDD